MSFFSQVNSGKINQLSASLADNTSKIGNTSLIDWIASNPNVAQAISDIRNWQKQIAINIKTPPYNAKYDGSDESTTLQNAINQAYANGGGGVFVPVGTIIAEIVIKDKVHLFGDGMRSSYIKAVSGSTKAYAVTFDTGAVTHVNIHDLCIQGNGNANQGGLQVDANKGIQASGGLWYSNFKNVEIRSFLGTCWHFRAGYDATQVTPIQFIRLEGCNGYRSTNGIALKMEGQCDQFVFSECEFSSGSTSDKGTGTNIVLQRKRDTDGVTVMGDGAPMIVTFLGCTSQNANIAFSIERAYQVVLDNCWLENLYQAVTVFTTAKATIRDCNFANAGSNGSGGGFCINNSSSIVSATNNFFQGSIDTTFKASTPTAFEIRNNKGTITSSGVTVQVGQSSGVISCNGNRTVLVNASGTNIITVNSDLNVGETITLMAWGGAVTFATGGNLTLGGASTLALADKQVVQFTKFDLGGTLVLSSKGF